MKDINAQEYNELLSSEAPVVIDSTKRFVSNHPAATANHNEPQAQQRNASLIT